MAAHHYSPVFLMPCQVLVLSRRYSDIFSTIQSEHRCTIFMLVICRTTDSSSDSSLHMKHLPALSSLCHAYWLSLQ